MTLTLAIAIIVVLDVALLGLLAFAMSRPSKLTPHVATADAERRTHRRAWRDAERASPRRQPLVD